MTFISALLASSALGVVGGRRSTSSRRGAVGTASDRLGAGVAVARPVAAVARRAGALRGHPPGVRQQRHLAGDLDRRGDLPLLLHVVAADPAVADLGPVAHEARQQVDVLVVDVLDLLGDQRAGLLLVLAGGGVLDARARFFLLAISGLPSSRGGSERLFVAVDGVGGAAGAPVAAAAGAAAAVGAGARRLLDLGLGPAQARAELVGDDLDDGALLAVLGLPRALLEAARRR